MSSNRKTIKINPELFSLSKKRNKTATKPRERRSARSSSALNPNALKKKLIERVKQHRNRDRNIVQNTSKTETVSANNTQSSINTKVINAADDLLSRYNDELNESLDYLSSIAEKNAGTTNAEQNSRSRGKRGKTAKNAASYDTLHVEIELPENLQSLNPVVPTVLNTSESVTLHQPSSLAPTTMRKDDVPYGCLKGGNKPTYKVWNKTMKRALPDDTNKNTPLVVLSGSHDRDHEVDDPPPVQDRQQKLAALKDRMKAGQSRETERRKHESVTSVFSSPPSSTGTTFSLQDTSMPLVTEEIGDSLPLISLPPAKDSGTYGVDTRATVLSTDSNRDDYAFQPPIRKKRTTTRKFRLGKDTQKRMVGVLIKDRHTRKRIIDAQKDMKRKNINEIKQYLKDRGLLKAGSKAPNDILRKMYESCMLAGDVTNGDGDVIMHNFLAEKDNT